MIEEDTLMILALCIGNSIWHLQETYKLTKQETDYLVDSAVTLYGKFPVDIINGLLEATCKCLREQRKR